MTFELWFLIRPARHSLPARKASLAKAGGRHYALAGGN